MDYEFRRDPFGGYRARFSMGHEAIGQWLIDEVGKDEEKLTSSSPSSTSYPVGVAPNTGSPAGITPCC